MRSSWSRTSPVAVQKLAKPSGPGYSVVNLSQQPARSAVVHRSGVQSPTATSARRRPARTTSARRDVPSWSARVAAGRLTARLTARPPHGATRRGRRRLCRAGPHRMRGFRLAALTSAAPAHATTKSTPSRRFSFCAASDRSSSVGLGEWRSSNSTPSALSTTMLVTHPENCYFGHKCYRARNDLSAASARESTSPNDMDVRRSSTRQDPRGEMADHPIFSVTWSNILPQAPSLSTRAFRPGVVPIRVASGQDHRNRQSMAPGANNG